MTPKIGPGYAESGAGSGERFPKRWQRLIAIGQAGDTVDPRNLLRRHPLQPDMMDDWTLGSLSRLARSSGAALPGLDITAKPPAAAIPEETALVARARAGDQDAFGA